MGFSRTTLRRLNAIDDLQACIGFGFEYAQDLLEDYASEIKDNKTSSDISDSIGKKFDVVTSEFQGNYHTSIFFKKRNGKTTTLKRRSELVLDLPIEGGRADASKIHYAVVKYLGAA